MCIRYLCLFLLLLVICEAAKRKGNQNKRPNPEEKVETHGSKTADKEADIGENQISDQEDEEEKSRQQIVKRKHLIKERRKKMLARKQERMGLVPDMDNEKFKKYIEQGGLGNKLSGKMIKGNRGRFQNQGEANKKRLRAKKMREQSEQKVQAKRPEKPAKST